MHCHAFRLRSVTAASALAAVSLAGLAHGYTSGQLGDAAVVNDNPQNAAYVAAFSQSSYTGIRGSVLAVSSPDGHGVQFTLNVLGLPDSGGPFLYHIHDEPVNGDGDCECTKGHLDPYVRGDNPPCEPGAPQSCQVGDLSGKYGPMTGPNFSNRFTDEFASLKPGIGAFFGNRSIVIHKADKSRIACANFAAAPAGSITYPAPGPIVYAPGVPIVPGVPPAPGLPYPTPVPGVPIQGPVVGTPIFNGGMTTSCLTTPAPYSGYSGQPGYPSVSCSAMTTTGSACSSTYNTLCTGNGQTSSCSTSTGSACTTTTTTVTGACVTNTVGPSGASYYSSGSYYPVTTGTATGTNSYSYSYSRTGTGTGTATTKPAQETSGSSTIRTSAADGWLSVGALVAAMFAFF